MGLVGQCPYCGHELVSGDYGYYCCNPECIHYDMNIEDYEEEEKE